MTPVTGSALALALATGAGASLVAFAFGRAASSVLEWLGRLALGAVAGTGITSLLTFAWLFLAGGLGRVHPFADATACLLLTAALLRLPRTRAGLTVERIDPVDLVLTAALLLAVGLAAVRFVGATRVMPHGEWDAWEIWNYRARFLLRAGDGWRSAFAEGIKGAEYPLLVPTSVARLWSYGGESTLGPALVAGLFTLGAPLVVAGLVAGLAGSIAGASAGLLLVGTSGFQWWGAQQYADVPLATLVASAAGVLLLATGRSPGPSRALLALGGLLLGLSGWTKTEGLAAATVVLLAFVVADGRRRGRVPALRTAGLVAVGALAPALAWGAQHLLLSRELAPSLAQGGGALAARMLDPSRWLTVVVALVDKAPGRDVWLPVVTVAIAALEGLRLRRLLRSPALWSLLALFLVDVLVFVSTPLDLSFHLLTAGDRLMLQLWPLFLVAVLGAEGPAEAAVAEPVSPDAGR